MNILPEDEASVHRIYCDMSDQEWMSFDFKKNVFKYGNGVKIKFLHRFVFIKYMWEKIQVIKHNGKTVVLSISVYPDDLKYLYNALYAEQKLSDDEKNFISETTIHSVVIESDSNDCEKHRLFFKSKNGLTLSMLTEHDNQVKSINLGYTLSINDCKNLKKSFFSYILYSKKNYFHEYSGTIDKNEQIEFLSSINQILEYLKETKDGFIYANKY